MVAQSNSVATAQAQELNFGYNLFGGPGLIDMPYAVSAPDAELSYTYTRFQNTRRNVLSFQMTPRLSASFRYSQLYDINGSGDPNAEVIYDYVFDRSFALHYRFVDEGRWNPAIAVGLNDFLGTGFFESEYFVATKTLTPRVRATMGIGWGRLAGVNSFDNPLSIFGDSWSERGARTTSNTGGEVEGVEWFKGDAALFGGVEWQATEKLRFIAEYSSDTYPYEDGYSFTQNSPYNFGLSYQLSPNWTLGAHYLYGSELALQATFAVNPLLPRAGSGRDSAPLPVVRRNDPAAASWDLDRSPAPDAVLSARTGDVLEGQEITLHGLSVTGATANVEIENTTYSINSQAIGRTARALSRTMPEDVQTFAITLVERGMPVTQVTVNRSDVETLEHDLDGAWLSYTRARIVDPGPGLNALPGIYPRASWSIDPYIAYSLFDPDAPLRVGVGADLSANWEPTPGLVFSGVVRAQVFGNLDDATRQSNSVLPRVRSESNIYDKANPSIRRLTAAYYFRPGQDLFGRVTGGYLESQFGGISGELLWAPTNSRFAFGTEINHVVQRDFDQMLGFRDYEITTGHVSAYWDMKGGYLAQVDVGRYLAGDWGATLSLDRVFDNGWRIGAFATLTDVPFDEFGEGSFDKGIRLVIPLDWATGLPRQDVSDLTIRPILRDGGARLDVDGRLYDVIHEGRGTSLGDSWGRFWR
jgi:hypothetical protein